MAIPQSMKELAARFNENPRDNIQDGGTGNNYYPFWNMKTGESATLRFLPDADAENHLGFVYEKLVHRLFIGEERHVIPCLTMWKEECPICKVSTGFFKAVPKNDEMGSKYWRKKQYLAQALIVKDPLPPNKDGETHEGKVRYISMTNQVHDTIKAAFARGDLEEFPYDFHAGTNFVIAKTQQGKHAAYGTSYFERRSSALSDEVLGGIELVDLKTLLPAKPELARVNLLLQQSLDPAYAGIAEEEGVDTAEIPTVKTVVHTEPAAVKPAAPVKVTTVTAASETAKPSAAASAAAILEKIRSRQAQK